MADTNHTTTYSGCECEHCKVMPHASDCALHNRGVPELFGPCSCGAWLRRARGLVSALLTADRASERSLARGGPDLDEPLAVAYDALDAHLKLSGTPSILLSAAGPCRN